MNKMHKAQVRRSRAAPEQASAPSRMQPDRPVSIADVARSAGVSTATVSRVMNGRADGFSEATARRVMAAVKRLKYHPSLAGSALRSGRNPIVALMLTDLTHAYSGAVAASVEEALRQRGKTMVLCNTGESPDRQDELLRQLRAHQASGIVVLGAVASRGLSQALRAGEPIVCVVRRPPGDLRAPFVGIDDSQAGREIAEHFLARGFRRVMVVHGPLTYSATADRVRSFKERMRDGGFPIQDLACHAIAASRKELSYALACAVLTRGHRPEAIFCTTDEIAFGVARRCVELGIDPARDVTLFGFDGNPLNEFLAPWLSTIRVPYDGFGSAVGVLLDRIWSRDKAVASEPVILRHEMILAPHALR